jgi:hypothetical protein
MNTQHVTRICLTGPYKKQKFEQESVDHTLNLETISKKSKTIGCDCGPSHKLVDVGECKIRKQSAKHRKLGHKEVNVRKSIYEEYEDDKQTRTVLAKHIVNRSESQCLGEDEELLKEW